MKRPLDILPTETQYLLLSAALKEETPALDAWQKWKSRVDIDDLDAASYRLLPLLHHNLSRLCVEDEWMPRLKGISRYHWCKNQLLLDRLYSVVSVLNRAGIDVMILKGSALIIRYYESAALRPMSDLDIMVRPDQIRQAARSLTESGWATRDHFDLASQQVRYVHHAQQYVDESGNECDLHWTPIVSGTWGGSELTYWKSSQPVTFRDKTVRVLAPTEQLFHILIHGGHYNVFPPIRWIADATQILRRHGEDIDWKYLHELASHYFCVAMLVDALNYLAAQHFVMLPDAALSMIRRARITAMDRFRKNLISRRIPLYRPELLMYKAWIRHSRRWPGAGFLPKLISFPDYFRLLIAAPSWREFPSSVRTFIAGRY